ncbi:HAMP domain-containing histidine kinase [Sphingomonas sp. A2-49]|uniref:sensor histidine kinase n=1 Tax=Sphingomonas sp. A2-49 TaxID=1391375 RepID=UPI0021D1974D|nr:HAMP domain-containing sensor histidine kinase [Sphingomonas sp. A2-49]MCU6456108.1 HAMP domain-containing histidine kinase [Sphingomonas sp. A2-49]
MPRLRSLRMLTLAFCAAIMAATVGTGLLTQAATDRTVARLVDARIAAAADAVAARGSALPTATLAQRIGVLDADRDTGDLGVLLSDRDGRRLAGNVAPRRALPPGFSSVELGDRIAGLTAGRAYVRDVGDGRRLTVIAETDPFDDDAGARRRIALAGFATILFVTFAGMLLFARLIAARIAATRGTARAIIAGDLRRRVPVRGDGGIFDAQAETFNLMLDRIAGLMQTMANVSGDIAHDLRTPLARLRSQLEALVRRADDPALRTGIEAALAQSDALLAMFAAILRIAEVEGGARRAGFAPLDLGELAHEVAEMMAPVVAESGRRLTVPAPRAVPVRGDRQLLTQLLVNLIENAIRHTPPGTAIAVDAGGETGRATLTVRDDGPGIAPAQRVRALRRFGRLDPSRAGAPDGAAGHGLGLALVEAIARLHDGGVRLEDAAPGLRVAVDLPVRPPRQSSR